MGRRKGTEGKGMIEERRIKERSNRAEEGRGGGGLTKEAWLMAGSCKRL